MAFARRGTALFAEDSPRDVPGALRRATEEAQQRGIFGAPTFTVEGEMFWGNDRLERAVAFETRA